MKINAAELPIEFFDKLEYAKQENLAYLISVLSKSQRSSESKIVAVEPDDILKRYMGLVAVQDDTFVGYVSATEPIAYGQVEMSKVGSLIVAPDFQSQGVGSALVSRITTELIAKEVVPYAFCNPLSVSVFADASYEEAVPFDIPTGQTSPHNNTAMVYMGDLRS